MIALMQSIEHQRRPRMIKGMLLTLAVIALFFGLIATSVILAVASTRVIIAVVEYIKEKIHDQRDA